MPHIWMTLTNHATRMNETWHNHLVVDPVHPADMSLGKTSHFPRINHVTHMHVICLSHLCTYIHTRWLIENESFPTYKLCHTHECDMHKSPCVYICTSRSWVHWVNDVTHMNLICISPLVVDPVHWVTQLRLVPQKNE